MAPYLLSDYFRVTILLCLGPVAALLDPIPKSVLTLYVQEIVSVGMLCFHFHCFEVFSNFPF